MKAQQYKQQAGIFFGLVLAVLFLSTLVGDIERPRPPLRYESEFVTLQPYQAQLFAHGFGKVPAYVYVWVQFPTLILEDIGDLRPWTEVPNHLIQIEDVESDFITIRNNDQQVWVLRVVADK